LFDFDGHEQQIMLRDAGAEYDGIRDYAHQYRWYNSGQLNWQSRRIKGRA
jgi:hypothetical protein